MNITDQLIKLLEGKTYPILISRQVFYNWKSKVSQPSISTIEKVIQENDFDVFISDGNLDDLIAFNKKMAKKKGMKMNIVFEI